MPDVRIPPVKLGSLPPGVPKVREVYIGSGAGGVTTVRQETFEHDVSKLSEHDIRQMMLEIVGREVNEQATLGNKPNIVLVDRRQKPLQYVDKRIDILFGVTITPHQLRNVEVEVFRAIRESTDRITGALRNRANWTWLIYRNRKVQAITPTTRLMLGPGEALVFVPLHVPHASVANAAIVGGGRGFNYKTTTATGRQQKKASKRNRNLGFMGYAARMSRRHLPAFNVFVSFVGAKGVRKRYLRADISGELNTIQGTAYLVIAPRRGAVKR